jgi:FkbM family methyltransferase
MANSFLNYYINAAVEASRNEFYDNHDVHRFGPSDLSSQGNLGLAKRTLEFLLRNLGLVSEKRAKELTQKAIANVAPNLKDFEWLYQHLEDDESREILVKVQLYKALGERRVKLPLNNKAYRAMIESAEKLAIGAETKDLGFMGWKAYKMRLHSLGYPLELFLSPLGVVHSVLLQQYSCKANDSEIKVNDGNVVIDAGGCYGETALEFALKAGEAGKIYSFEFLPGNLSIFYENLKLNPDLARRIKLIEKPLWDNSGDILYIEENGPGTRVGRDTSDSEAKKIQTVSIDDLVNSEKLSRLDFIKMDIEGAELNALIGAENSIRRFKPKLAISIYHKPEDFWTIPQYIAGLGLGYRFALRHFTIHSEETVLFAF